MSLFTFESDARVCCQGLLSGKVTHPHTASMRNAMIFRLISEGVLTE